MSPSPPVEVGTLVTFEVVLWQPPPRGWNLQYAFNFGDGSPIESTSDRQATHTYLSTGNGSYPVHVEIVSKNGNRIMSTKAIDRNLDIISPSNPSPSATESPSITASPTPATPSPSPVTPSPTASYTPVATAVATATPFSSPTTSPPPASSKMPWLYIVGGLVGVLALARLAYAKWKPKVAIAAPLAFYPHSDWDTPQTAPKNVTINYGLYFHSNVSAGEDRLETDGASSILKKQ